MKLLKILLSALLALSTIITNVDVSYAMDDQPDFTLNDYEIVQNGNIVDIEISITENSSKFGYAYISFYDEVSRRTISFYLDGTYEDGVFKAKHNIVDEYRYYPYGNYKLIEIELYDTMNQYISIDNSLKNYGIELNANNNPLENFDLDENTVYFRVGNGYGEGWVYVQYLTDEGEKINLTSVEIDPNQYDLSKPGKYTHSCDITFRKNYSTEVTLSIDIPVEIVEVEGEIIYYNSGFGVSFPESTRNAYPDYYTELATKNAYVKLNSGEIITIPLTLNGAGGGPLFGENGEAGTNTGCSLMLIIIVNSSK